MRGDFRSLGGHPSCLPPLRKPTLAVLLTVLLGGVFLGAQGRSLFYLELQGVAAYSSSAEGIEFASLMTGAAMQKPSLGFDYILRLSETNRDIGVLAVQARLAYDQRGENIIEIQLHNAYFRWKAGFADIWAGHNRPPFGLSYPLDSHALLLPSPAMTGFGYDRDWGVGLLRDFAWGDASASLTAGTGLPLYLKGNYLTSFRVSKGVLARDNSSFGLSFAIGRVLETMGHELLDGEPMSFAAAAMDATVLWRNLENRFELLLGGRSGQAVAHIFWRGSLRLLDEGRLTLEVQPAVRRAEGLWAYTLGTGASFRVNADLTARTMVYYDRARHDTRYVLQFYYYKNL